MQWRTTEVGRPAPVVRDRAVAGRVRPTSDVRHILRAVLYVAVVRAVRDADTVTRDSAVEWRECD